MFNKDELKKMSKLPDEVLKEKISIAIKASGADNDTIDLSKENLEKIKSAVSKLTQDDIDRLLTSVSKEQLDNIKNKLNENI